ncbi:MAG: hypothetical protein ABJB40_08955 [Acidobacteriota bacterium]
MNIRYAAVAATFLFLSGSAANGQGTVVINNPTVTAKETKPSAAEQSLVDRNALPRIKAKFQSDTCDVNLENAGVIHGAFTRAGAVQTLTYFQVCQTGNGLGVIGLALIDNGKVIGNFASDGGWTDTIEAVPDVNQNGLSEFTLSYSGGLHQGHGGVGVDLVEFKNGLPVGIGWYLAEKIEDTDATQVWKLTAKPGKEPVYYRQRFLSNDGKKWRRAGIPTAFKLGKAYSKFTAVK